MTDGKAYDFSIVPGPDKSVLVNAGARGILGYSFNDRQTDEYLDGIRAAGMKVCWIWERDTDSIFNGYDYMVDQCKLHEARAKPGELTYIACDTNDGGVGGRLLTPGLQGWSDTTREDLFGLYGSSGAIRQGKAFGGKLQRFWGVVNWINGGYPNDDPRNVQYWRDQGADLIQMIASDIPNTDLDLVLTDHALTLDSATPTPIVPQEDNQMIQIFTVNGVTYHMWLHSGDILYRSIQAGTPQTIVKIPFKGAAVKADMAMGLRQTTAFGTTVLYAAAVDGREIRLVPSAYGYLAEAI